jgi:phenylacetate-CoA ligase
VTSYELLTGSLRDLLTEVFGCEVYTQYGASELTDIANQCEEGRLHVRMDMVLFEAVRDGRPARPGELARVLVTDLDNFNMPFIRYDLGDVVRLADGECPCGRRTQAIAAIEGRIADTVTAGGRVFTALEVDEIFRRIPGLAAHRLIQEAADRYRVSLMREPGAAPDTDLALRRCRSALGERSRFQIDVVDEITPEASNKFCFLRSRLGPARL